MLYRAELFSETDRGVSPPQVTPLFSTVNAFARKHWQFHRRRWCRLVFRDGLEPSSGKPGGLPHLAARTTKYAGVTEGT